MLIIGIDSQIGHALATDLKRRGIVVHGTSHRTKCENATVSFLDLRDRLPDIPFHHFTDVVICAGITSIEACERNEQMCLDVNVHGTLELIDRCLDHGCFVIFLSSNAVFDGTRPFNRYDDAPNPRSAYGHAKLAVESHLLHTAAPNAAVIRFTKVVPPRAGFIEKWRSDAAKGAPVTVYEDKLFSPVTMRTASNSLQRAIQKRQTGIFQTGGNREITYLDFALKLFENEPDVLKLLRPTPEPPGKPYFNKHNSLVTHQPK